jgi:hypothetical protein
MNSVCGKYKKDVSIKMGWVEFGCDNIHSTVALYVVSRLVVLHVLLNLLQNKNTDFQLVLGCDNLSCLSF